MFRLILHFIARILMAIPELSKDQMQFWVENPKKLNELMKMLADTKMKVLHEQFITVSPQAEPFDPIEFLLGNSRIVLDSSFRDLIGNYSRGKVNFNEKVRYTHLKRSASNSLVRGELPESHLFEITTSFKVTLLANLFKHHFEYGGALGFSPTTPNIFYFGQTGGHVYIVTVEAFGDDSWRISNHSYVETKATAHMLTWPPGTRVFFPDYIS